MHAYDSMYLERARVTFGSMLDYAVHGLRWQLKKFYGLFLATGLAARFGSGEANLLAGNSGIELAHKTLDAAGIPEEIRELRFRAEKSAEFWTGWALAYYQWETGRSFAEIERVVPAEEVRELYHPYHEMDIRQFADAMEELLGGAQRQTALARLRKYAEMSQSMLAARAGIPVRTIQQYEQKQKDIAKAGAESVERLARVLHTTADVLMG